MEKIVEVKKPVVQTLDTIAAAPAKIVNQFPSSNKFKDIMNNKAALVAIGLVVVLLGVGTGKVLAGSTNKDLPSGATKQDTPTITKSDTEAGISDVSEFAEEDSPEGILKEGGIKGEGTHHLERTGGTTQTVYLSSTVLDLQSFVDKKVKIWGQTISGKSAGWLMDVVKVKVIE